MLCILMMAHGKNPPLILQKGNVHSDKICLMFQVLMELNCVSYDCLPAAFESDCYLKKSVVW